MRTDDVAGIEVGGVELDMRVGGRQKVRREALAASELAIGERRRAEIRCLHPLQERQKAEEARRQLLIEAVGILDIDNITR